MIFDIIQNIVLMILPSAVIIALLLYLAEVYKNGKRNIYNAYKTLKALVCVLLTGAIAYSIFALLVVNIYYVATILKEIELSYIAKELMFTCITFIWNIIGAVLIFNIWRHIYYHNYDLINRFKTDWKKIKERKTYGRHKKTNKL